MSLEKGYNRQVPLFVDGGFVGVVFDVVSVLDVAVDSVALLLEV